MKRITLKKMLGLSLMTALLGGIVLAGCSGGDDDEGEVDKTAAMRGKQEKDD